MKNEPVRKYVQLKTLKLENLELTPQDQLMILEYAGYRILSYADWIARTKSDLWGWRNYYRTKDENDEGFVIVDRSENPGWPRLREIGVIISMLTENDVKFSISFDPNHDPYKKKWFIDIEGLESLATFKLSNGLLEQIFKLAKAWKRAKVS